MRSVRVLLIVVGALTQIGRTVAAEVVPVTTVVRGPTLAEPVQAQLHGVRVDGAGSPFERPIAVPSTEFVDIPSGNWVLSIRSHLFWSTPAVVSPGRPVSMDLWPAGTLRGTVKTQLRGAAIEKFRVSFSPSEQIPDRQGPVGDSDCSVDHDRWSCLVPAGTHDFRFLARGFAAEFHWNRDVQAGKETDLGVLNLIPGASLSGLVATGRGVRTAMKEVVVEARPTSLSANAAPRRHKATVNARGFFRIAGLAAGEYLVHAETKGLRSEDRPARVIENVSAELRAPLVLDPPRKVVLTISPAGSEQEPWQIHLFRQIAGAGRMEDALTGAVGEGATWSGELLPGHYFLQVGRDDESVWSSKEFDVEVGDVHLEISIPSVTVAGIVKLGERPLANARLIFGGEQGVEQQTLVTDDSGHFRGELPAKDNVKKNWTIAIQSDIPQVRRTAEYVPSQTDDGHLRFDIELPQTIVRGRVVNEDRRVAEHALVTLQSPTGEMFEQARAGTDGTFELFGFDPGVYRIQAGTFQHRSEVLEIHADAGEAAPIELVLRKEALVKGRIQARTTAGVEATLMALQRDVRTALVPYATTDSNGLFELRLPPRTRIFDLIVQSPGFALATGRVQVQDEKQLTITVDQLGGNLAVELPVNVDAVIRHDGAEFPARWLATHAKGTVESKDGWDVATLPNVEAGQYSVCANGRCQTGIVTPNGSAVLSLR